MSNLGRIDPRSLPQIFAWYDANFINGFGTAQPAADAAIGQWNDLSGNGRHLVQGTGANQPLFRLTGGPDNRPSVNFVDNTDTMAFNLAGARARPITVVGIYKNTLADDAAVHRAIMFNTQRIGIGLDWAAANAYTGIDDQGAFAGGTIAGDITTYHVGSFVAQPVGTLSRSGVDGLHVTGAGIAGTNTDSSVDVGCGAGATGWIGHVCEAIVLTGELNASVMFSLEQSLAEKWTLFGQYRVAA